MIHFVHRGAGGRYSTYTQEVIRRVNKRRPTLFSRFSQDLPAPGGVKVAAVARGGEMLTPVLLNEILQHADVTFLIGDSRGLSCDDVKNADYVVSVTGTPVSHQMLAAIVAEQLEYVILCSLAGVAIGNTDAV